MQTLKNEKRGESPLGSQRIHMRPSGLKMTVEKNANKENNVIPFPKKDNKALKDRISKHIEAQGWATFPQMMRVLQYEGFDALGNHMLTLSNKNLICWDTMSESVVVSLSELINEGKLELIPAPQHLYAIEGMTFQLPVILDYPDDKLNPKDPVLFLSFLSWKAAREQKESA